MNELNDITLVLCVDKTHIEELKFSWYTWTKFKPEIVNLKYKILIFDEDIEHMINSKYLPFLDDSFLLYKFPHKAYYLSQRDAMLTSWFNGFELVKTPFYLKLDTDCFAINDSKDWIQHIEDRNKYVFISSPWGYTKNADRIIKLENWADNIDEFKSKPRLNLIPNENNTIIHPRIISFFFIGNTEWTKRMSSYCILDHHIELPVPSQDTFLWYCAARGGFSYKRIKFKKYGFIHTRLKKAKKIIRI